MTGRFIGKVPGGKLLRIEVEVEGDILARLFVRGDFFAHPEELFEEAEAALVGLPVEGIVEAAAESFGRSGLVVYGASASEIAEGIRKAVDAAQTA